MDHEDRLERAVARWVMARHNAYERTVVHRILDVDQIQRAWFDHIPGYAYSEYTQESPSACIEYVYTDNTGRQHTRTIDIDGQQAGVFVGEVVALLESG